MERRATPWTTSGEGKIKIAFVIDYLSFGYRGGTEGQLLHLLEGIDRERFTPTVFCLQWSDWAAQEFRIAPLTMLDLHVSASPALPGRIWSFARLLRREKFDIVQTHFRDANVVGVLAGWLAGVPYWDKKAGLLFLRWLNRRVSWFIANSRATRDRYAHLEGLDPARVEVIYNGLDPTRFRPRAESELRSLRAGLGLPPGAPVIGIIANLRPVKGIDDFLHAARRVADDFPDARFLVVGEGPEEEALRDLSRRLGLEDRVLLLGPRRDVADLLQMLDVGVLASHFESFSNAVLEYLASGLPVVVTDVGGAREVVRESADGFIVPPRDPDAMAEKILVLLHHPGGPRSWRRKTEMDSVFSLRSMVEAHERLYARLVERTDARTPTSANGDHP